VAGRNSPKGISALIYSHAAWIALLRTQKQACTPKSGDSILTYNDIPYLERPSYAEDLLLNTVIDTLCDVPHRLLRPRQSCGLQPDQSHRLKVSMRHFNMFRNQKSPAQLRPSLNSAPPVPTAIDIQIANNNGSTVAIEAMPDRVQAAKKMPTPSLSQMIEQLTWQNGQLRSEIDYHQRLHGPSLYLLQRTKLIVKSLQQVIENFESLDSELRQGAGKHNEDIIEKVSGAT
jgi:hypothetical protein